MYTYCSDIRSLVTGEKICNHGCLCSITDLGSRTVKLEKGRIGNPIDVCSLIRSFNQLLLRRGPWCCDAWCFPIAICGSRSNYCSDAVTISQSCLKRFDINRIDAFAAPISICLPVKCPALAVVGHDHIVRHRGRHGWREYQIGSPDYGRGAFSCVQGPTSLMQGDQRGRTARLVCNTIHDVRKMLLSVPGERPTWVR